MMIPRDLLQTSTLPQYLYLEKYLKKKEAKKSLEAITYNSFLSLHHSNRTGFICWRASQNVNCHSSILSFDDGPRLILLPLGAQFINFSGYISFFSLYLFKLVFLHILVR